MLTDFWGWLAEARRAEIDPAVLHSYDLAFRDELLKLIRRTENPALRAKLEEMLDCPVRDQSGRCRQFSEYIAAALLKNGIHHQYDLEAALQYVIERMLMPQSETTGAARSNLFSGFTERPDQGTDFNPLQVRFMTFLDGAIRNIKKGKVPRLRNVERRPEGTVSIGVGRQKRGETYHGVSPEAIPGHLPEEGDFKEMIADIEALLRRRQQAEDFPLVDLFRAILAGANRDEQRARFGDHPTRAARQVIVQTIRDYAEKTGNFRLLHLLRQFEGFRAHRPLKGKARPVKEAKPKLSDKERDYRSLASVVARFNYPIGTAQLGSLRRRWLEYPPRNPASGHRNRLEEVLAAMVADGVLRAIRTNQGATLYGPGTNFDQYSPRQAEWAVA